MVTPENSDDVLDLAVGAGVIVAKVPHKEGRVEIIMDETSHHGRHLGGRDGGLRGPAGVV